MDFEGTGHVLMEVLALNSPGRTVESHYILIQASVPAVIRTEHLPNPSLERYHYTSLLGKNR
jgi:hypothetical protein